MTGMKTMVPVCLALLVAGGASGDSDIYLGGRLLTFTNLQGRVFANVKLERANLDGVIYSLTNGAGGGMVKFKDLSTNFLASLNIPLDRLQIAQQREKASAEQKLRYDAAVRALALKQRQQEAIDASNALAQAANAATNQSAASSQPPSGRTKERKTH
jgi:hypothetical protein